MYGPEQPGHWTAIEGPNTGRTHQFLVAGRRYRVTRPFTDFDGDLHAENETWAFLGCAFLPYDDGLSLFVSLDGTREWHIRMQQRPEEQGPVIDHLDEYVAEVTAPNE